jgi:hypothetical protein
MEWHEQPENERMKRLTRSLVLLAAMVAPLATDRAFAQTPRPVIRYLFRTAGLPLTA